jgi:hypothetical protein
VISGQCALVGGAAADFIVTLLDRQTGGGLEALLEKWRVPFDRRDDVRRAAEVDDAKRFSRRAASR